MSFLPDHWSNAEAELVRRLWNEKGFSASRISAELRSQLGCHRSRNSVLSFVHRNKGFAEREAGGAARRRPAKADHLHAGNIRNKRASRQVDPVYQPPVEALPDAAEKRAFDEASLHVSLIEAINWGGCRFGVNDPAPGGQHLFCGLPTGEGETYCQHHAGRARRLRSPVCHEAEARL